ncbi:NACHT domain-containing protein [Streptomyces sp. NPDC127092]|uniref:NACHT domain-containing protein n=1 Tax=Streptomyces sp. NPDC127092 TaxID=3347135 RepID=UPI00364F4D1D
MSDGGRGSEVRGRGLLGGLGLTAVLAACVLWALRGRGDGPLGLSERTDLIAMVVGVSGLAIAALALARTPEQDLAVVVARLAREVKALGEPQWTRALGGDLQAIDVAFSFRRYTVARAAELPATPAGRLEQVVEDFLALRPRRMVITGEPGAGKTVLARKFVMELNRVRPADEPVPVLVNLADWDTDQRFDTWLARHLSRDYGLRAKAAERIVAARMVLPVLDGLDEMEPADAVGTGSRAGRALAALARQQDGTEPAPLVLTCRSTQYDALEAVGGHILDAARLEIAPVAPGQAVRFLELRGAARRPELWRPLLDELRDRPDGVLAGALSTPWRLTLAAVAYDREGDPAELIGLTTEAEVADRLLSRFVAASTANALVGPGRYAPQRVHRGLRLLAVSLGEGSAAETDLVLTRLARQVPKWLVGAVVTVLMLPALLVNTTVLLHWDDVDGAERWLSVVGMLVVVGVMLSALRGRLNTVEPTTAVPRLGSPLWRLGAVRALRRAPRSFAGIFGLAMALVGPWVFATRSGLGPLFVTGISTGALVTGAVSLTLSEVDRAAVGPTGALRNQLWMLAFGVPAVVLVAVFLPEDGPERLMGLSVVGLVTAVGVFVLTDLVAYVLFLLLNPHRVPFRLARFLDWSVAAGLMRTSGAAYQFRHREFQEWLVRHPGP